MIVQRDTRHGPPQVTIRMTVAEFRETVEWLETLSPDDGCTRHWRDEHDRVFPPTQEADERHEATYHPQGQPRR